MFSSIFLSILCLDDSQEVARYGIIQVLRTLLCRSKEIYPIFLLQHFHNGSNFLAYVSIFYVFLNSSNLRFTLKENILYVLTVLKAQNFERKVYLTFIIIVSLDNTGVKE